MFVSQSWSELYLVPVHTQILHQSNYTTNTGAQNQKITPPGKHKFISISFFGNYFKGFWRRRNHESVGRRHLLSMTETVFTLGLKEHLPFPDSVLESMWNTCSCNREERKSENLETVLYDTLFHLVASTTINLHVWPYQMPRKLALLTFPTLMILKKCKNGFGLVYLKWPTWDSKKNIPFRRRGGISLLMSWIGISPSTSKAAKFQPDWWWSGWSKCLLQ